MAAPVDHEQARQAAAQFIEKHFPAARATALRRAATAQSVPDDIQAPYYAFNIGGGQGFVIVSGDDRTVPILGYSDHGDFDVANMPETMRSFLQEYEEAIRQLRAYGLPDGSQQPDSRRATERSSIEPIVKTSYNQSAPYWNDTPVFDYGGRKNHAVTGCVATAMAQVMATFHHPARTKAEIPSYDVTFLGGTYTMPAIPADSVIHWELITDEYVQEYTGTPAEDAVAALMTLCGYSVQMKYSVNELGGSGATVSAAAEALVRYFDYEERTVRLVRRNQYSSTVWENMVYDELKAGRPIIYSGLTSSSGHTFICDGYDADERLYHINWGWGGVSDGYFSLMLLSPQALGIGGGSDATGYGMGQTAIVGLQPNDDISEPLPPVLTVNYMYPKGYVDTYHRDDVHADFKGMSVCYEAWNWTGEGNKFDLGLRIIDSEGNTVQDIADSKAQGRDILVNSRWNTGRVSADYAVPITVSGSLPDGSYRIVATSRITGSGDMYPDANYDSRCIIFSIVGEKLYVTSMYKEPVYGLSLSEDITIKPVDTNVAGKPHRATVTLHNDGSYFRDDIFFTLNDPDPDSKNYTFHYAFFAELGEGDTYTYNFNFTPNQRGENTIRLYALDNWGNPNYLGVQTITVEGAPEIKLYVTDIAKYDTEQGAVVGNTLKINFKLANEGYTEFTGRYDVFLSYSDDEGATWVDLQYTYPTRSTARTKWELTLPAGGSAEKTIEWKNLNYARFHRILFALNESGYYYPSNMLRTEEYRLVDSYIAHSADVNGDGVVNALDIQEVINAAVTESANSKYDINGDGLINALDIQGVINAAAAEK